MTSETAMPPRRLSHSKKLVLAWAGLVAIGTALLHLPAAANGESLSWLDALFTATSAVCVTGLSTITIGEQLSTFGQAVLLGLIQIGGLGIGTVSTLLFLTAGQATLSQQFDAEGSLAAVRVKPLRLLWWAAAITITLEAIGAFFLAGRMGDEGGWWFGVFHSVSAFCNAGFSLFSDSLSSFQHDPVVNVVIGLLIIQGGLGFIALRQLTLWTIALVRRRRFPLFLHTRVVLFASVVLWLTGAAMFASFEWFNTLSSLDAPERLMAGCFQSVTTRTAGFNTIDIASLREPTLLLTMLLMLIGGAPGSCAGGIKVTVVILILAAVRARVRGSTNVTLFDRTIPNPIVARAFYIATIAVVFLSLVILGLVISEEGATTEGRADQLTRLAFEAVSAFGTVGLSTGITASLSTAGKLLIILTMFVGRLGPLAIAVAVFHSTSPRRFDYPKEDVALG